MWAMILPSLLKNKKRNIYVLKMEDGKYDQPKNQCKTYIYVTKTPTSAMVQKLQPNRFPFKFHNQNNCYRKTNGPLRSGL